MPAPPIAWTPTMREATKAFMKASGGAAAAIDFVGAAATFSYGLAALRKGGKLVSVGLFGGSAPVMTAMLPLRAVTITGSYVGSLAEMGELMALARQGGLPAMPVTPRPLAEVNEALAALRSGAIRGPRRAAALRSPDLAAGSPIEGDRSFGSRIAAESSLSLAKAHFWRNTKNVQTL